MRVRCDERIRQTCLGAKLLCDADRKRGLPSSGCASHEQRATRHLALLDHVHNKATCLACLLLTHPACRCGERGAFCESQAFYVRVRCHAKAFRCAGDLLHAQRRRRHCTRRRPHGLNAPAFGTGGAWRGNTFEGRMSYGVLAPVRCRSTFAQCAKGPCLVRAATTTLRASPD